jgi:hypothetical protein
MEWTFAKVIKLFPSINKRLFLSGFASKKTTVPYHAFRHKEPGFFGGRSIFYRWIFDVERMNLDDFL